MVKPYKHINNLQLRKINKLHEILNRHPTSYIVGPVTMHASIIVTLPKKSLYFWMITYHLDLYLVHILPLVLVTILCTARK